MLLQTSRQLDRSEPGKVGGLDSLMTQVRHLQLKDSGNEDKASIAKIFEQGCTYFHLILYCLTCINLLSCFSFIYFLLMKENIISGIAKDLVIA